MPKRSLDFQSVDEAIAEVERLQESGYEATGRWNLTQICDHLTKTMRLALDGNAKRLPWLFRKLIGGPAMRRVVRKRRMPEGVFLVKQLKPVEAAAADDPQVIARCVQTLREASRLEGPLVNYPVCDNISAEEWKQLCWIHAAHHLGFLAPRNDAK